MRSGNFFQPDLICSQMESNASISKLNRSGQRIHVEMGRSSSNEEEEDNDNDINDSEVDECKELSYKLFQFKAYKLRGFNGELGCPFCVNYEEGEDICHYTHLLLHAVRVAEVSENGKQKANHFAMARYLAIDLADEVKAEAEQLSRSKDGKRLGEGGEEGWTVRKRPRLDEDCTKEEALEQVRQLERELDEKTDQMNDLIMKERLSNDELQGARRELIKGLSDILKGNQIQIGVKNAGEIDSKVFIREMKNRFSPIYAVMKGLELCSVWQEKLKNPHWYPFQIIEDEKGKPQRLLKEDDASLQDLKQEWGQVIHDAVVVALNDLHEYNPGGCYVVPELWNFKEDRKAALDEVIRYILEAVKDAVKMGSTSDVNNSRITEHRERGSCLDKQHDINDSRINNSDEESGIRESEIYEHKDRIYKLLRSCTYKVRGPNGQLRCPFCFVEEEQDYSYLFRHALMAAESSSASAEQRANHSALVKYLVIDLPADAEPPLQCTRTSPASRSEFVEDPWEINTPEERCRHEDDKTKKGALEKLLNEEKDTQLPFQNLLARERPSYDELQGARNEAMKMGEIDVNAFKRAYRKRFPHGEADIRAIAECSKWEEKLKNPQWHPVQTDEDYMGNHQRVVTDDDLRGLKDEWGDEVYNAVVTALDDLRKDNPSGGNSAGKQIWRKSSAATSSKN